MCKRPRPIASCSSPYWLLSVFVVLQHTTHYSQLETAAEMVADPKFSYPISNVTASVGREALLTCVVQDLGSYKVAWLRVDTQTILTIQNHVITKNQRIGITYSEHRTWQLKIKDIKETDKGWYMCQINTDPMKSQMGYLDVVDEPNCNSTRHSGVCAPPCTHYRDEKRHALLDGWNTTHVNTLPAKVPPDILDYPTSTDMVVREGSNVTLKCAATGSPEPTITWRRENGLPIGLANGSEVSSLEGLNLVLPHIKRHHMGAYLCIASNGVPPSVSKRITLIVHFPPMITVQNQLIGAVEGKGVALECQSEAFPKSINYWTRERGEIVPPGGKFVSNSTEIGDYKVAMKLHIFPLAQSEFGSYRCVAKNSLGDTDGTIKLYRIPPNAVNYLDNFDGRPKGKKRVKSSELYHQAKSVDTSDDPENPVKRKDIILVDNDDTVYDASSANSVQNCISLRASLQLTSILVSIKSLVVML